MHSQNSDMQQTYVAIELIKRVFVLYYKFCFSR